MSGMHEAIIGLGLAGAVLPALSAALFGVRAYRSWNADVGWASLFGAKVLEA